MADAYLVTDDHGQYERRLPRRYPGNHQPWAMSAEDAAETWAKLVHTEVDQPDQHIAVVTEPDGTVTRWLVVVEHEPTFAASPLGCNPCAE